MVNQCDLRHDSQAQRLEAQTVLDAGGDYFFQLKNENRHAYKAALQKASTTPFLPTQKSLTPTTDA